eukprot:Tamp_19218.p1 GENE.Tamp_19218~~Tamp_19218.p1  ORF type:complete len:339 (-),score=54.56 Tamp_19218:136-1152(-)
MGILGEDFNSPGNADKLAALRQRYAGILDEMRGTYADIDEDLYLCASPAAASHLDMLLKRYLVATDMDVEEAALRLRETAEWRRDWEISQYYSHGAAARYMSEAQNPGAEVYIADSLATDLDGDPFLIGRGGLINTENMHPWHHLRGMVYVIERFSARHPSRSASYILDVKALSDSKGTYSASGGKGPGHAPAKREASSAEESKQSWSPSLLARYGPQTNGLGLIKTALDILNRHYPERLKRIIFLNADLLFLAAFKIFSLWAAPKTRDKFMFLNAGWGTRPMEHLFTLYPRTSICPEWGGTGSALNCDKFIEQCAHEYDRCADQGLLFNVDANTMQP